MTIGDYIQRSHSGLVKRAGEPLSPRTKAGYLTATRTFFRDLHERDRFPDGSTPPPHCEHPEASKRSSAPTPE
ncbi:hypothetical protein ACIBIZ_19760 [Nonomuraea spiralis]|uniref:hypothetical protein n=1 Tax=Nonomuraea spiralis TaxID=46182 RepID=UPI003788C0DD